MNSFKTILNGQPTTIHVSDKTWEASPRWDLCFEYWLLDDGKPHHRQYANCVDVKTDEKDEKKLRAILTQKAEAVVAAVQADFDERFQHELDEINEFVGQVDEKLLRRTELESIISERRVR